ncbi:MAG: AMP-binding protein [Bacteroidetes bacterium]|nr:AMP-binding protein [Bacteroidota bacterium]
MENLRLFDFLYNLRDKPHKEDALAGKVDGVWIKYSTEEYLSHVENLSYAFIHLGIQPGEKIGLISSNCPEWNFVDYACLQTGTINTPVYPTISEHDLNHIIQDAEISYFFIENEKLYDKIKSCEASSSIKEIFCFRSVDGLRSLVDLVELGKAHPNPEELKKREDAIHPNDMATLIYTSGTTGNPKGVMLSHRNFISNVEATRDICPFETYWRALSFLPLNHVYERMLSYVYIDKGISVYYAESMDTIAANLLEVKPQIFVTVPRLLEKVYEKILSTGTQLKGIKKGLFFWALHLGLRYEQFHKNGTWYDIQLAIANALIFKKWREALGGNIVGVVSGGSALQPRLARVFHAAKIPILEGYGLTETSPVIAVNQLKEDDTRIGTVGPILFNEEVKIAEDGEILVKGPNVMLGYYHRPEITAEVIDEEGWFHTGDIGQIEEGRFLRITDRKKEMFKTSGGKYITPQIIENSLKESRFIEQAMVIGENKKFPAAFIVPSFSFLRDWSDHNGVPFYTHEDICHSQVVKDRIWKEVEKTNANLAQYEKIKKIELLPKEWSVEDGEMTPKLSLKRKIILAHNKEAYDRIYAHTDSSDFFD